MSYTTSWSPSATPAAGVAVDFNWFLQLMANFSALNYQTGTWTPTIISSGGGTPTYTTQVGRYWQFGGLVHVQGVIALATKGTLAAGNVSIGGLPFTSVNVTNAFSSGVISVFAGMTTPVTALSLSLPNNVTFAEVIQQTGAVTSNAITQVSDIAATLELIFALDYMTV